MTQTILFVQPKEALFLIKQTLLNENKQDLPWPIEFANLELGENLYRSLCAMIEEGFLAIKRLKSLAIHHQEVNPGTYIGLINHLVFYKWWQEKEKDTLSLLQCEPILVAV